jgi:prephenate dehydrogenase
MAHWDTVVVVGVGLIGGSIGLDLRAKKLAKRVVGVGRRAASLKAALAAGCVTETTTKLEQAAAVADLVIVCTPVGRIVADVLAAAAVAKPKTLITDVGSTKGSIVAQLNGAALANGAMFIGSHPLAGSEKHGPTAAVRDLFRDRVVVVTPTATTPKPALRQIETLWKELGAKVVRMDAAEHDRALAATSHVPHLAASALAGATPEQYLGLTGGGWLDTTRIAGSDGALWAQIFDDNRVQVLTALCDFEDLLAKFRKALESRDTAELARLWNLGLKRREAIAKKKK